MSNVPHSLINVTHSIISNDNGSYSVALIGGYQNESIITTFGDYATYYAACNAAHGDSLERHGHFAIFGANLKGAV